jgi:hypothetical protein
MVMTTGAMIAIAICQAAGGAVDVRRGIRVKRNPTAKQVMKPSICAKAWKIDRYSWMTPVASRSQCRTPAQASRTPSGKSAR